MNVIRKNVEFISAQLYHPLKNNPKHIPECRIVKLLKNVGVFNSQVMELTGEMTAHP